jgi:hypothetical protein
VPFWVSSRLLVDPFICLRLVKPLVRRLLPTPPPSKMGLRLFALARMSGSELDASSSIGGGDCTLLCLFLRVDERVTGPK